MKAIIKKIIKVVPIPNYFVSLSIDNHKKNKTKKPM